MAIETFPPGPPPPEQAMDFFTAMLSKLPTALPAEEGEKEEDT